MNPICPTDYYIHHINALNNQTSPSCNAHDIDNNQHVEICESVTDLENDQACLSARYEEGVTLYVIMKE